ncbi:hypothetical protein [Caldimonas tepidiphila]|uniref:hypothetical protein n=1 Tax=Caldimonas tepidiphila TaxID=2315841 RepID=UPI0013007ED6|nr:hypothetical protein [Caldimonas tepidiphila]
MRSPETINGKLPCEHPSRERGDHANLSRPEAHPGNRPAARPAPRPSPAAPRRGRDAWN